jgi:hypothetical protein
VVRNKSENNDVDSYSQIAGHCMELDTTNPGSKICCQLDSEGRFFRLFIMLQSSLKALDACLPCLEIDGSFMKHHTYNGVCVVIVAKTSERQNVPIAMAMVPCESTDNFVWVFLNLKAAGINLDNMAVFSDRGKQMNAQQRLAKFGCTWLHIKNCTHHLANNVCALYGPNDHQLRKYIFSLQKSESIETYIRLLVLITKSYGKTKDNCNTFNDMIDGSIMLYLMNLHPCQYSVIGNLNITDTEEIMLSFIWGSKSYGMAKPLFGTGQQMR